MLGDALGHFADQAILVVGDVMLDEYIYGTVKRISPEAPIPIVETQRREYRPGGASNVARNIAALGGTPLLCGIVGTDAHAAILSAHLHDSVAAHHLTLIPAADRPTTLKTRVVAHGQQMLRLDTEQTDPISSVLEDALMTVIQAAMPRVAACVLSDYAKGVLTPALCARVMALGHQLRVPIIVDPKGCDFAKYRGADVLTPNLGEAALASGIPVDGLTAPDRMADPLLQLLPGTALLITRGEAGMSLYQVAAPPRHIPAMSRAVYDVTGAGDTVVAVLALALASGSPLEEAIVLANLAAGEVVSKLGTSTVTLAELRGALVRV